MYSVLIGCVTRVRGKHTIYKGNNFVPDFIDVYDISVLMKLYFCRTMVYE